MNASCGSEGINIGIVNGIDDTRNDRINDIRNDNEAFEKIKWHAISALAIMLYKETIS